MTKDKGLKMRQEVAMLRTWPGTLGILSISLAAALLAGCQPGQINETPAPRAEVTLSASRLAQDLRLQVTDRTTSYVKLQNAENTVIIYADAQGQVFVNRQRLGAYSGIFYERGDVFVPAYLESQIRPHLLPGYTPQTPPTVIRPSPTMPQLGKVDHGRVLIDPGHGGKDPGTTSAAGLREKVVVLDVGLKLWRDLGESGVRATMTRSNDTFVELDERAAMSNRQKVDLFVAIHADAAERTSAHGFTVYISRNPGVRTRAAAAAIERAMSSAGFSSQGIRQAGYRVLVKNEMPAVLIELGYLSNPAEAEKLNIPGERSIYAHAIADGIVHYLKNLP
jgi:N-acetylmuramoyl-L-alanine amidase